MELGYLREAMGNEKLRWKSDKLVMTIEGEIKLLLSSI